MKRTHFLQIRVRGIVEERHRELVPAQKDRIWVILLRAETRPEVVQRRLRNNSSIS